MIRRDVWPRSLIVIVATAIIDVACSAPTNGCPSIDPTTATVVSPTPGHCEALSGAPGPTGCGAMGSSYLVRSGVGSDLDLDIVIYVMYADYTTATLGSSCTCRGPGEIADPPGDWRTIATLPADGGVVAAWPGAGILYACVPGDRPPNRADAGP